MSNQQPTTQEVLNYRNLMAEHRPCEWCDVPVYHFTSIRGYRYIEVDKVYCCKCGRKIDDGKME